MCARCDCEAYSGSLISLPLVSSSTETTTPQMMLFPILLLLCHSSVALKIIVYNPKFAHSHVQFMGTVADTLQSSGHQVTVLQPFVTSHVEGSGSVLAKVLSVKQSAETWENRKVHDNEAYWEALWSSEFNPRELLSSSWKLNQLFSSVARNLLSQKELLKSLKDEKFDVMITELLDFTGLGLSHILRIPSVIGVSSLGILEGTTAALGSPLFQSFVPASHGISNDDSSFWNRAQNLVYSHYSYQFQADLASETQKVFEEMKYRIPKIWDMVAEMPLILTNSDPLLDFPRLTLHKIVDIGGISIRDPSPLTEEYSEILGLRPHTLLISFGTIAFSSKMPAEMKNALVRTVERFPNITFILKYEDELEKGPKSENGNLVLKKWFPQNDLLADDRVVLFITHGGVASTYEAAARGVPVLFVPSFSDQMRNAQMVKRLGFGEIIKKNDLRNENSFSEAIKACLENEGLTNAARETKDLLQNRPFDPKEVLVRNVELAGKFPKRRGLSSMGRNLNSLQFYNLDIYFASAMILGLFVFLFIYVRLYIRRNYGGDKKKEE